jgi:hypothetical protein
MFGPVPHRYVRGMEETTTNTQARRRAGGENDQAPTAFNRRDVSRNTRPRQNQEIDRRDYDRSIEVFARVLGN